MSAIIQVIGIRGISEDVEVVWYGGEELVLVFEVKRRGKDGGAALVG
tara:strand:- start:23 stop:163 length:141 start_codon:yes stop_codon:yes gene_type:complete